MGFWDWAKLQPRNPFESAAYKQGVLDGIAKSLHRDNAIDDECPCVDCVLVRHEELKYSEPCYRCGYPGYRGTFVVQDPDGRWVCTDGLSCMRAWTKDTGRTQEDYTAKFV